MFSCLTGNVPQRLMGGRHDSHTMMGSRRWLDCETSILMDRPVSTFAVKCLRKLSGLAGGHRSLNVCLPRMHFVPGPSTSSLRFLVAMRGDSLSLSHTPFCDALLQSHANSHQAKQSSEAFKIVSQKNKFYFLLVSWLPQRFLLQWQTAVLGLVTMLEIIHGA